jgi:hypothetical protein
MTNSASISVAGSQHEYLGSFEQWIYLSSQIVPSQCLSESPTRQLTPPGLRMRRVVAVGSMRNLGDNLSLDSEALDDTKDQSIFFYLFCHH